MSNNKLVDDKVPAKLHSWIDYLGERLTNDGASGVDATLSTAKQLLNHYYTIFGPNCDEPSISATDDGIAFTFELGNATLLGEAIGEYLNFESMDESFKVERLRF